METSKMISTENFENLVFEKSLENSMSGGAKKSVVLVAGASASGKGYITENLQKSLEEKGIKAFVLCLDDFYKGISLTITGKANKNFFGGTLNEKEISEIVREVIEESKFDEKFSLTNCAMLYNKFSSIFGSEKASALVTSLKTEFGRINFDEPDAVNLQEAAKVINLFARKEKFEYPICGMDFSRGEHRHTAASILNGQDFDVLIVEGIYGLTDKFLASLDNSARDMTKLFITTDFKTMLVRRLSRDILQGRSSMSVEGNLKFMLEVVLPAFNKYILPCEKNADFVLKNQLSKTESYKKPKDEIQDKIRITDTATAKNLLEKLTQLGFKSSGTIVQEDWFFESTNAPFPDTENIFRLRIQDGMVETCIYKGAPIYSLDGKIIRPTEVFLTKDSFKHFRNGKEELLYLFTVAGLKPFATVEKKRTIFQKEGGNCTVNLDKVTGLGNFVEISSKQSFAAVDKIKNELGLENLPHSKAYLEEVLAKRKETFKIESEVKFVLESMPNLSYTSSRYIEQTYLNLQSEEMVDALKKLLPFTNFAEAKEARVRIENSGEKCFLTVKNGSIVSRNETEMEISLAVAEKLTSDHVIGKIFKTRYVAQISPTHFIEVDKYQGKNLITAEVEFDISQNSQSEIEELVKTTLNMPIKNVTKDPNYKNVNLAKNGTNVL